MPLGRHVNHDPRSRQYAFKAPKNAPPLVSVRHNINLGILDQGEIGSCVPNTGTEYLAWDGIFYTLSKDIQDKLGEPFAVDLYRKVTRKDPFDGAWEPDDTGSDGLTLAQVLKELGLISGYVHTFDVLSALTALQTSPLAIGIEWLQGCFFPDSKGQILYSGNAAGGHEILVDEYDAENQRVWIRNHWTDSWGIKGRAWFSVADFTRALKNDGDVIVLVPNTQPAPLPTPVSTLSDIDKELIAGMEPWSKGIFSKVTKAGKANQAYLNWKSKHTA
jgi:hypothetical protein